MYPHCDCHVNAMNNNLHVAVCEQFLSSPWQLTFILTRKMTGPEMHSGWLTTLVEGDEMPRASRYTDPVVSKN